MDVHNGLGNPTPSRIKHEVDLEYIEKYPIAKVKELEKRLNEEYILKIKDNREMRKEYAHKAYAFARNTLICWGVLVFLYVIVPEKHKIMDIKMFGIITSACTINILVAFHAVIKGLFSINQK